MSSLSKGDLIINQDAELRSKKSGLSANDMLERIDSFDPKEPNKIETKSNTVIPVSNNDDGSVKYTFDNIYQNDDLIQVARNYYTIRDNMTFDEGADGDKKAIDKFIRDRTWKQANSFALGKEYLYITGEDTGQDQKARLAYLTRTWDALPDFYEEGGRGFSGFFANLGVGILDPINLLGAGVGGRVAATGFKAATKEAIKQQVKKGVATKAIRKEILNSPEDLANLASKARKNAILKGSASMSAVDGAGFGTIDIADQIIEKEIGVREKLDPYRTGTVALTAAGLGFFVPAATGLLGNKIVNLRLAKNTNHTTNNIKKNSKKSPDNTNKSDAQNSPLTRGGSYIRTNLADQWDFVKVLQEEITGVKGDVATLKKLYKKGDFKSDPILEPYFQLRQLASSGTRAHGFIMGGVYMPPSPTAKLASYTKGKSKGLHEILKPLDKNNEVNDFLSYVAAKRQDFIAKKRGKRIAASLPMNKATRQEYIDFGEMTAAQFKKKYKTNLTRKNNFITALDRYTQFTKDLLEYQVRSGLIDADEAKKILKANPFFIPLTRDSQAGAGIISGVTKQTQQILRGARPGARRLATTKQEGDINLYQNLVTYTYQTVLSGDRNRAKIALYNMLEKGDKLGKIDASKIVSKVKGNRFATMQRNSTENIKKAYEKAGAKMEVTSGKEPKAIDVLTFSNTFKPSDGVNFVDVVYRNGKAEYYEIIDPNMEQMFKGLGEDAFKLEGMFFGERGLFTKYARFASQAITYSPPFVAFNVIRDTLAGAINSAFGLGSSSLKFKVGYIPGFTSAKGYIGAVRHTQQYKEALLNGMGYSSRTETEALRPTGIKNMIENGSRLGVSSDVTNYYTNILKRFTFKPAGYGWRGYKRLVQSAEYATRMGEFQLAKAAGFSEIGAAFAGREVATDFGMRGASKTLNFFNRNTMFFNASIQGLYRTGRVFFEQPARAAGLLTATVVAPAVSLYHLNSQFAEYAKVPDRVKQLNYLIPNFKTTEDGKQILDPEQPFHAIPKPYDLGVFANIAEGLLDGMYKKSDGVTKQYIAGSFAQVSPGLPIPALARPWLEMIFNKNLYSGSPVAGLYELQRLDVLQARGSTRQIAKKLSNASGNFLSFITRRKEGTVDTPIFTPIEVDYLIGAYFTGLSQYPFDILEQADLSDVPVAGKVQKLFRKERGPLEGEAPDKRVDEADFSSFKNAVSIVTRRFKVGGPIKNSKFHTEFNAIINKAKQLKQIDIEQLDLERSSDSRIIGLFGRIFENIEEGDPPIEPEVMAFSSVSPILNETAKLLRDSRKERNAIMAGPLDGKTKRELIDILIAQENLLLKNTIELLADMDIEFLFDKTFGIFPGMILGTAEDSVKRNPKETK